MKKVLTIFGGIVLVLFLAGLVFGGIGAYQISRLNASSKAYLATNVRPIVDGWSQDELVKRASPQLMDVINKHRDQFNLLFLKLPKLGTLKSLDEPKGQSTISVTSQNGKMITATYTEAAEFENGKAELRMRLIQLNGQWQYLGFYVNSPEFLK